MLIHFTLSFSNALSLFPVSIITHSLFYSLPLPLLPSLLIGGGQRGSRPSVYCNLTPALTSWTLQEEAGRYIPTPTYFFTLKQWFTTIIHKYSNHHTPRWFDNRLEKLAKILISFTFMDLGVLNLQTKSSELPIVHVEGTPAPSSSGSYLQRHTLTNSRGLVMKWLQRLK